MMFFSALLILPLLKAVSSFSPTMTVVCTVAPSYTFTLADASDTGVIFIDGQCEAQSTAVTGDYTFNAAACTTGTVPALGTEFKAVVQEFGVLNSKTDYIAKVTCNLDTASVTQVVTLETGGEEFDEIKTASVAPTFSVAIKDDTDIAIDSGDVGDNVNIVISIPTNEVGIFDYQIISLVASTNSGSATIIEALCTKYAKILAQPDAPTGGILTLSFLLFIPWDTATTPTLPGNGPSTVTYTFTIDVCSPACEAPVCARKRRSITSNSSTIESVEVATSLVVYPLGTNRRRQISAVRSDNVEEEVSVCLSRTPLIGVMVALSIGLAVCVGITSWMFCRLRRSGLNNNRLKADFRNHSYKA